MSQPPVQPYSGYPEPDPQSYPGYGQPPAQPYPRYSEPEPQSYPGYGQPAARPYSGYPEPDPQSYPGYGQPPAQPRYSEPGPQSYPGYGQPSGQPYPGWSQPAAPAPPKKSKTGKIVLIVLAVVLVLCAGGGTAAYFALKDDVGEVVQASKTRLVMPDTLAGRPKITEPKLQAAANQMIASMKKDTPGATSTVGAFYGDPAKKDMVMIAGASGLIADPAKQLDDTIKGMGAGGLKVTNAASIEPGPLGGVAKCGDAKAEGVPMGVCVWADRGSVGMITVYFKTGEQAKAEFVKIRGEVEQRA